MIDAVPRYRATEWLVIGAVSFTGVTVSRSVDTVWREIDTLLQSGAAVT